MTEEKIIRAGVIGHPIKHSKSPLIHRHWIAHYGLRGAYETYDIASENLGDSVSNLLNKEGLAGFNVTIPHKEAVIPFCNALDNDARAIGAVNTIYRRNGEIIGGNSDAFGFMANLETFCRRLDNPPAFNGKKAVILGAGGAARAALYALIKAGFGQVVLINRTQEKAQTLASLYPGKTATESWDNREAVIADATLLVNTTSLGQTGQPPLPMSLAQAPANMIVYDIVYNPLMTALLQDAKERDLPALTGIGMLLHQARPAFEKWFGIMPEVDETLTGKVL